MPMVTEQWYQVLAGPFETTIEAEVARVNASRIEQGANAIPALIVHELEKAKQPIAFSGMFHVEKRQLTKDGPNRYFVVRQATVKAQKD